MIFFSNFLFIFDNILKSLKNTKNKLILNLM